MKYLWLCLLVVCGIPSALAQSPPTDTVYMSGLTAAGALADTDQFFVCQDSVSHCPHLGTGIVAGTNTQLTTYFRSKFSVSAPLSYNSSTGAFSVSAVTDLALPPGFTPTVGTCNSTLQHITATGTINQQDCIRAVTTSTALLASDSGFIVKAVGAGINLTAFNPIAANQGVTYQMMGDGTNPFTVGTVSGTALFQGCAGGGGTSVSVPPGAFLAINVDNTTTPVSYACMMQGVLINGSNSFSNPSTFSETHGTTYTPTLTSNNYTLQTSDCGKTLIMPAGTGSPTVTLFNYNGACSIAIDQAGPNQYTVTPAGGATYNNVNSYSKTKGPHATIFLYVEVPSGSAAVWVLAGDGA